VRAAREERRQHHQVGQREQPLFRLRARRLCRTCNHAQMTAAREIVEMLHANSRQAGYFRIRENFLTRLDFNQRNLADFCRFHPLSRVMLEAA